MNLVLHSLHVEGMICDAIITIIDKNGWIKNYGNGNKIVLACNAWGFREFLSIFSYIGSRQWNKASLGLISQLITLKLSLPVFMIKTRKWTHNLRRLHGVFLFKLIYIDIRRLRSTGEFYHIKQGSVCSTLWLGLDQESSAPETFSIPTYSLDCFSA